MLKFFLYDINWIISFSMNRATIFAPVYYTNNNCWFSFLCRVVMVEYGLKSLQLVGFDFGVNSSPVEAIALLVVWVENCIDADSTTFADQSHMALVT